MINCKYIGNFSSNCHPYLVGTSGKCSEETAKLITKYFEIKSNLKSNEGGKNAHNYNCECEKCLGLLSFGNSMVEYTTTRDEEAYRVHLKHLVITND